MAFNTKFSLLSFLKQVNKLTETQRNSITQVGFGHLLHIPSHVLRRSQLIELMERWNIERQSFIFPPGDITITLLDVVLILGLRVIGQPVVLKEDTPLISLEQEFGASVLNRFISVESLKERLEALGERADSSFVRAFLLYCFGTLLFPSVNGKVDSRYLLLLEDLNDVSSFAWGAAVREELHESLTQWKSKRTSSVRGCLILLQIWCYEHIVIGRPKLLDCPSTLPRVCRWESSGRQYLAIKFEDLDHTQILWRLEPTSVEIQLDIIKEIPQEWYLRSGAGTMEEPISLESERGIRMVQRHKEEQEQEEEPMRQQKSTIFVLSDELYLRSGAGTMEEPILLESERGIRMVQRHKEEQEQEEEPMKQQKSTIFVLSDDDDTNSIKDPKEEILELKARVDELTKENEVMKKEKEVMKEEIEELRMSVEKLQSDKALIENAASNLERILSEYDFDL